MLTGRITHPLSGVTSQPIVGVDESPIPFSESPALTSVASFLKDPSMWCVGAWARTRAGRPCSIFSPDATQWSLLGAINFVHHQRDKRLESRFDIAFYIKTNDLIPSYPWDKRPIGSVHSATAVIVYWERMYCLHNELMEILHGLGI